MDSAAGDRVADPQQQIIGILTASRWMPRSTRFEQGIGVWIAGHGPAFHTLPDVASMLSAASLAQSGSSQGATLRPPEPALQAQRIDRERYALWERLTAPLASLNATDLAVLLGATLLAGLVRGFSGFGSAMILVPSCSRVFGPAVAIPIMSLVDVAGTAVVQKS